MSSGNSQSENVRAALRARAHALRLARELAQDSMNSSRSADESVSMQVQPAEYPLRSSHSEPECAVPDSTHGLQGANDNQRSVALSSEYQQPAVRNPARSDFRSDPRRSCAIPMPAPVIPFRGSSPSADDEQSLSLSPSCLHESMHRAQPSEADLNWFDSFAHLFKEFRAAHGESLWFKILLVILIAALVIGVFLVAGCTIYIVAHGKPSSPDVNSFSTKKLCLLFNLTLPICLEDDDATVPEVKVTKQSLESFDIANFEPYKFQNFLLLHEPIEQICTIFPGLNPRTRSFSAVPFKDYDKLLLESERSLFEKLCNSGKVFRVVKP